MRVLIKALPVLLLAVSCRTLVPDTKPETPRGPDFYDVKVSYSGFAPVSGEPLFSTYAPIWIYKAIACRVNGSFLATGKEYPDIFINKATGTFGDIDDPDAGGFLYYSRYQGKSTDGRLLYADPVFIKNCPWSRGDSNVRILNVGGQITAFLLGRSAINVAEFNSSSLSFGTEWQRNITISGFSEAVRAADLIDIGNNMADVYYLCGDGTAKSETMEDVNQGYYDAYGSWRGVIGNGVLYRCRIDLSNWSQVGTAERLAEGQKLIEMPQGITVFYDKASGKRGLIYGNKFGVIKYAPIDDPGNVSFLSDSHGKELINPSLISGMMTFPSVSGSRTDLVTSGEGAFFYYRFTGSYDEFGAPVFEPAEELICRDHPAYSGSLCVPSVVDWDKDGVLDIISGNSEGRILFFKNYGTDAIPAFGEGQPLMSCGEVLRHHAGYFEVQGPDDGGAWGYICPNVIDWDGDGILDIVFSSNSSRVEVMLGNGSGTLDCLGPRMIITLGGAELWGMWRVRPGVTRIGTDIYLAFMDTDNAVHLYRKVSLTSVEDCGQLKMTDGNIITGHRANAGSTLGERGRSKLEFADWDGDGIIDLLIGTPQHSSFPNPTSGLPEFASQKALHVLYFRNAGSNNDMVFEYPKEFQFKQKKVTLGGHAQSPAVCRLGDCTNGPNLLVGCESGRFYFYKRSDLNFIP